MGIIGQILLRMAGGDYLGCTQARLSTGATFGVEVIGLSGTSPTLEARIEHKNSSDTTWTTATSFSSMTTTGVFVATVAALKEQWRYVYSVGGSPTGNAVHFSELGPLWSPPLGGNGGACFVTKLAQGH